MSKATHSAGHWFVNGPFDNEADYFIRTRIGDENYDIANFGCDETGDVLANIQLMVTAPKLLAALKWVESAYDRRASDEELSEAMKEARDAIREAERQKI